VASGEGFGVVRDGIEWIVEKDLVLYVMGLSD
jgi:hypothetical protein